MKIKASELVGVRGVVLKFMTLMPYATDTDSDEQITVDAPRLIGGRVYLAGRREATQARHGKVFDQSEVVEIVGNKLELTDVLVAHNGCLWSMSDAPERDVIVSDSVMDALSLHPAVDDSYLTLERAFTLRGSGDLEGGSWCVVTLEQWNMLFDHPDTVVLLPMAICQLLSATTALKPPPPPPPPPPRKGWWQCMGMTSRLRPVPETTRWGHYDD